MTPPRSEAGLAELAQFIRRDEVARNLTPAQRDAMREAADGLRSTMGERDIPLTADTLSALLLGAGFNAGMEHSLPTGVMGAITGLLGTGPAAPNIGPGPNAHWATLLVIGQLADDLLSGVRS